MKGHFMHASLHVYRHTCMAYIFAHGMHRIYIYANIRMAYMHICKYTHGIYAYMQIYAWYICIYANIRMAYMHQSVYKTGPVFILSRIETGSGDFIVPHCTTKSDVMLWRARALATNQGQSWIYPNWQVGIWLLFTSLEAPSQIFGLPCTLHTSW